MEWLKENWFKVGFLLVILGVGVSYIALPRDDDSLTQDELLTKKIECAEIGRKAYDRYATEMSDRTTTPLDPEFAYNRNLNTCLYAGGIINTYEGGKLLFSEWVRDTLTNETLVSFIEADGEPLCSPPDDINCIKTSEEFTARKAELFRE